MAPRHPKRAQSARTASGFFG